MSDSLKAFAIVILVIAGFFVLDYTGLLWESFIGPRRENIRREIFENTRSFNEGKRQDLIKYYYEYQKADETGRIGICSVVRQSFAGYDLSALSIEQKSFVRDCGGL